MPEITFYLKEPKSEKETAVCISLYCDDNRVRKSTGTFIHPDLWDKEGAWFKSIPRNKDIAAAKSKVDGLKRKINLHINDCQLTDQPLLAANVEAIIKPKISKPQDNFIEIYKQLIEEMKDGKLLKKRKPKGRYTPGSIKTINQNMVLLDKFQKVTGVSLEPSTVTNDTLQRFAAWMNSRPKAALNYVSTHIVLWRNILDIMRQKGYHNNTFIRDQAFTPSFEVVDKIKLEEADVIRLFKYDLSDRPLQQAARDRWVLMFATGLRVGDNRRLQLDHFGKTTITLVNQKTGKKVVIPYHWMVKEILKRYKGSLPRNLWPGQIGDQIKKIAKDMGFTKKFTYMITRNGVRREETKYEWELFVNHTARRSMTSHLIKNKVSHDLGGDMMGMSPQTWKRYNKLTPEDKADVLKGFKLFKKG